jgi:ubiquinone/menaquinone biosynthesis C-methylase UbiE
MVIGKRPLSKSSMMPHQSRLKVHFSTLYRDLKAVMNRGHPISMFRDVFICMKLFRAPNDCDVIAVVLPSDVMGSDVIGLRLRCHATGHVCGRVLDRESPYWELLQLHFPPGFHILQARLSEFTNFSLDADASIRTEQDLLFEVVDQFGIPIVDDQIFACYARKSLPTPTRDHIVRVAGDVGTDGFLFGGATWHYRLKLLAKRYQGRDISPTDNILDWGVGCGRIARHFFEEGAENIRGADIDAVNVRWLNESLGRQVATRIDFDPPMPFHSEHFDIIYGHSVFTHLAYDDQFKWLGELRRVLKPGGFAFLTVCTEPGVYVTRFQDFRKFYEKYITDGFYDLQADPCGVDEGRDGYYRLVFHTQEFITEHWSKYFTIRRTLPCYMEHQSLLILQKPS